MYNYPHLKNNEIILRRPEIRDAVCFCSLFGVTMKKADTEQMILAFRNAGAQKNEMILTIADAQDQAAGIVEIYAQGKDASEIGYRIAPACMHQGYAQKAVQLLLPWMTSQDQRKIYAHVEKTNLYSAKVLCQNGFVKIGETGNIDMYQFQRRQTMIKIKVLLPDGSVEENEYEAGITPEQILSKVQKKPLHQIYACQIDSYYERLNQPISSDCTLSFCDITNSYGNMVMQGSLTLLYLAAIHEVVGPEVKVTIANSLSKGLFTIIHDGSINEEIITKIEKKMAELVRADLPILETVMDRRSVFAWLKQRTLKDETELYKSAPDLTHAMVCTLGREEDLLYYHAVPSAGYLKLFELRKYRNGVLLRFPHPEHPDEVLVFEEQKLLYDAFSEETHWENLCGVNFASDLNRSVEKNTYKELIQVSEALHEKKIAEIAEKIKSAQKRIILIAGPSSSGKTSFAKRLCIQLQVIGLKPLYLGTDDYFVNREDMIVGPDGKKDLESLSAVDVRLFTSQMNDLLAGKKVDLPTFDFIKGEKIYGKRITSIDPTQPIVIEGIHGLNPAMTDGISADQKFKIYISPLTQLNLDLHHRVPTTDARMLRRMVRDYRTRGRSAAVTIDTWPSVRTGEDNNIFPYSSQADAFFNSQCIYELAVLKKYAEPLLKGIHEDQPEYAEAQRMLQFLEFFVSIQDDSYIANNSIIREFIGGSILVD